MTMGSVRLFARRLAAACLLLGGAASLRAEGLALDPAGPVVPRIFSPNGDGVNDIVYFAVLNPSLAEVRGRIFDVSGGEVADLAPAGPSGPTPDSLVWDGRDRGGSLVPPGAYLFSILGEGKTLSGAVVVAR